MLNSISVFLKGFDLQEKTLALYIITLPLINLPVFTFNNRRILYADIMFLIIFIVFLWRVIRRKQAYVASSLEPIVIVMVLSVLPSFLNSISFVGSIAELSGMVYLILIFMLIPSIIREPEKLSRFLYIWLITAFIVCLVGLFAFILFVAAKKIVVNNLLYYSHIEAMAHHFPRINSTLYNPNMLCTYLHVSLIFSFILFFLEHGRKRRSFILICICVIFITAFFTGSRRFTGLLLSLFLILCWYGKSTGSRILKGVALFGFLLFLIASIITSIWVIFPVSIIKDNAKGTVAFRINDSYSLHFLQPVTSVNMIKRHPFIGVGLGTYNRHFNDYVDWDWVRTKFGFQAYPLALKAVEDKTLNYDPHSFVLGAFAETGIFGLVGVLCFLGSYFVMLIRGFKTRRKDEFKMVVSGCILAGFIGFLFIGLFTDILSMRHFWFLMAIGLFSVDPHKREIVNVKR